MTNHPDPVEVLKELAKQHKGRVASLNLYDPIVATTSFHWREALEQKPIPPDRFRRQVRMTFEGRRVTLRANDRYVVIETRAKSAVVFSVNRADEFVLLLTEPLPIAIGPKKLPVFVSESRAFAPAPDQVEIFEGIEALDLGADEILQVARNAVIVYVTPPSLQRIVQVLERIGPLVDRLPQPQDDSVDFSDLPSEFADLVPLMTSWAKSDDQERSDTLGRASTKSLSRLVSKVGPHFDAISRYLDGFRGGTLPEAAAILGTLAECATEAQLLLTNRRAFDSGAARGASERRRKPRSGKHR